MLYSEIIFLIIAVILIIMTFSVGLSEGFMEAVIGTFAVALTLLIISFGGTLISMGYNDYVTTAEVPMTPKYVELNSNELLILGDDNHTYTFTDYSDVSKWEKGGKFYKVYKYKQCFGRDEHLLEVVIK